LSTSPRPPPCTTLPTITRRTSRLRRTSIAATSRNARCRRAEFRGRRPTLAPGRTRRDCLCFFVCLFDFFAFFLFSFCIFVCLFYFVLGLCDCSWFLAKRGLGFRVVSLGFRDSARVHANVTYQFTTLFTTYYFDCVIIIVCTHTYTHAQDCPVAAFSKLKVNKKTGKKK
jgi:hypothetical protein